MFRSLQPTAHRQYRQSPHTSFHCVITWPACLRFIPYLSTSNSRRQFSPSAIPSSCSLLDSQSQRREERRRIGTTRHPSYNRLLRGCVHLHQPTVRTSHTNQFSVLLHQATTVTCNALGSDAKHRPASESRA